MLAKFDAAAPTTTLAADAWWQRDWASLPAQRNERDARRRWALDVQVAGPLPPLQKRAGSQGLARAAAGELGGDRWPARRRQETTRTSRCCPATLEARAEALLLLHPGKRADEQIVLRLWPAPATLDDGTPLWMGTAQTLRYQKPLRAASLWLPVADDGHAHAQVRAALLEFEHVEAPHPDGGGPVLRLRTR